MEILILEKLIPKECLGMRYDATLAKLFPDYSRAQLLKWLKLDYILLDGKSVKPTYKVKGIELVRLECPKEIKTHTLPQDIPIDIKYEDDYLLILNKPANLVVHPGAGNPDGTLVNALLHYNIGLESLPRAGIVHRLDKDTTGLMIVAKTLESSLHSKYEKIHNNGEWYDVNEEIIEKVDKFLIEQQSIFKTDKSKLDKKQLKIANL